MTCVTARKLDHCDHRPGGCQGGGGWPGGGGHAGVGARGKGGAPTGPTSGPPATHWTLYPQWSQELCLKELNFLLCLVSPPGPSGLFFPSGSGQEGVGKFGQVALCFFGMIYWCLYSVVRPGQVSLNFFGTIHWCLYLVEVVSC